MVVSATTTSRLAFASACLALALAFPCFALAALFQHDHHGVVAVFMGVGGGALVLGGALLTRLAIHVAYAAMIEAGDVGPDGTPVPGHTISCAGHAVLCFVSSEAARAHFVAAKGVQFDVESGRSIPSSPGSPLGSSSPKSFGMSRRSTSAVSTHTLASIKEDHGEEEEEEGEEGEGGEGLL